MEQIEQLTELGQIKIIFFAIFLRWLTVDGAQRKARLPKLGNWLQGLSLSAF